MKSSLSEGLPFPLMAGTILNSMLITSLREFFTLVRGIRGAEIELLSYNFTPI
jgi:hypothetical protein